MGPLLFEPYLRPQIWGGRALETSLGKRLPTGSAYGESWEVSAHPHHVSVVSQGPYQGMTLSDLCAVRGEEIFGPGSSPSRSFPLLIKFLDCHDLLSVQVHPDDAGAHRLLGNEKGKTEAWIVLEARPTAKIYAGLKPGIDAATFRRHVEEKTTDQCLHSFTPSVGDCIYIPAGTIHTMGGGVLIAEVQQSSDATFRIFDWNRVDKEGRPRPLHLKESLASIDYARGPVAPVVPLPLPGVDAPGVSGELLVQTPFFQIDRYTLVAGATLPDPGSGHLSLWMIESGSARLSAGGFDLKRGETVLMPAETEPWAWQSLNSSENTKLIRVTLPAEST